MILPVTSPGLFTTDLRLYTAWTSSSVHVCPAGSFALKGSIYASTHISDVQAPHTYQMSRCRLRTCPRLQYLSCISHMPAAVAHRYTQVLLVQLSLPHCFTAVGRNRSHTHAAVAHRYTQLLLVQLSLPHCLLRLSETEHVWCSVSLLLTTPAHVLLQRLHCQFHTTPTPSQLQAATQRCC